MAAQQPKVTHGSCLCGQIRIKAIGEPVWANLCYCSDCRKSSGVIFRSYLCYPEERFEIIAAANSPNAIRTYGNIRCDSGHTKIFTFCDRCGSQVCAKTETNPQAKGLLGVPMGILDVGEPGSDTAPVFEVYCKRRPAWFQGAGGSQKFDTIPSFDSMREGGQEA